MGVSKLSAKVFFFKGTTPLTNKPYCKVLPKNYMKQDILIKSGFMNQDDFTISI